MTGEATTRAIVAKDQIRNAILGGRWAPGTKVIRDELAKSYGISSTLVREALIGLVGEHLLEARPNHGFIVPELNLDRVADLGEARVRIDTLGIELSFERGDLDWESDVVVAHHKLARAPRETADDISKWVEAHRVFHDSLISACGVDVLRSFSSILFNATELYRRWSTHGGTVDDWMPRINAEHEALLMAAVDRDTEAATNLISLHHRGTYEILTAQPQKSDRS